MYVSKGTEATWKLKEIYFINIESFAELTDFSKLLLGKTNKK